MSSSGVSRAFFAGKSVYIKSYGCQMNVYDATRMFDVLKQAGFSEAPGPDQADLVLLNTCHIREKAAEKVYSELGRLNALRRGRQDRPLMLGVAGCVAQAEGQEMLRRAPFLDVVFGPQTYHMLPAMLRQRQTSEKPVLMLDFPEESKFDYLPEETADKGPVSFLTVQEGCDKFCTYCVVPYTRGVEVSRPVDSIVAEAEKLVASGSKELVLLGQNVSAYHGLGPDGREWGLGDLIRKVAERLEGKGLRRLRYTTSHPRDTQDDLIAAHRDIPLLMPFLHLPVQAGSDKVLKEMNRQHPRERYIAEIARFRQARPDLALSSDFIVGFPGESDQDFDQTMDLVRQVCFSQAYSFKYSPRPGTPGADRTDQVPEDVKTQRLYALQALLRSQSLAYNQMFEGQEVEVLIEKDPGAPVNGATTANNETRPFVGRTPYMQLVHFEASGLMPGDFCAVKVTKGMANSLAGTFVEKLNVESPKNAADQKACPESARVA